MEADIGSLRLDLLKLAKAIFKRSNLFFYESTFEPAENWSKGKPVLCA